ncbi:MAG: hypothetical protein ACI376_02080 [Candidatus Bruticola sp.]
MKEQIKTANMGNKENNSEAEPKMGRIYRRHRLKKKEIKTHSARRSFHSLKDVRCMPIAEASPLVLRLRFAVPEDEESCPSWSEISAFLVSLDHTLLLPEDKNTGPQNPQYEYYNSETRAYAKFVGYLPDKGDEVGLEFELSLPCPHVFALECFLAPIVTAREFNLRIDYLPCAAPREDADKQGYALKPLYSSTNPVLDDLMLLWHDVNVRARQIWECIHGASPRYRRSFLECVWEYRIIAPILRSRYSKDKMKRHYADIEFYQDLDTQQVFTMCEWSNFEPAVFPITDRILIHSQEQELDGKIIDARTFFTEGKTWLKKMSTPMKHYFTRDNCSAKNEELCAFLVSLPNVGPQDYKRIPCHRLEDV